MTPSRTIRLVAVITFAGVGAAGVGDGRAADSPDPVATSRSELVNRWDLNRDGSIDEAEAEIARTKMRRERTAIKQRAKTDRLVPGDERRGEAGRQENERDSDPLGRAFLGRDVTGRADGEDRSVGGDRSAGNGQPDPKTLQEPAAPIDNPARRRDLNAGRPKSEPSGPGKTAGAGPDPSGRIMTGGARAGAPAIRPGYGASGPKVDLNAGRLPAGLPPARGLGPMGGSAPFRPLDRNGTIPSRGYEPVRPTITPLPRPTITAEEIGSF